MSRNEVKHETWITNPIQMNQKIQNYWSSYWNRDSADDQVNEEQWRESIQIIDSCINQHPEISIPVADVVAWRTAIRKTKTKTAKGSCGFSKSELDSLPDSALEDLIDI